MGELLQMTSDSSSGSKEILESGEEGAEKPTVILAELVGASHLKPEEDADGNEHTEIRPYCIVKYGDKIIHRSKESSEVGLSPIWTIETRSLFLLKVSTEDLTRKKLTILLYNRRRDGPLISSFISDATLLGQVQLDLATVISHCDEKRFEISLDNTMGEDELDSTLALRFRLATEADRMFVSCRNRVHEDHSSVMSQEAKDVMRCILNGEEEETRSRRTFMNITEKDETVVAGNSLLNSISSFFYFKGYTDRDTGIHMIRVKPFPDPARPADTEYLTKTDIKTETLKPSRNWTESGSGKLGTLHLEILSCHDLPNTDTGEAVGNVTDAFVCAIFEDVMVQTPVIDDELSPHWLPWSQRAFRFGIMHPASMLYLGVFDYDFGITDHEAIGRVAINISNYQRDTTYCLTFNLHKSSNVTDRTPRGVITVRLRIEMHDEKAALMAAFKPRPKIHVNVKKEKSFHVVRYTCFGEYDNEEKFDLTVLRSYINEIFEYKMLLSYIFFDSFLSLMFWKGQVEILGMLVPIHSFIFFCAGCILIERPYMLPCFVLLSVAWIMLACMSLQRHHPSPWMRCQSFQHYLQILLTGKSSLETKRIAPREGWEATQAYDKAWEDRLARDQKRRDEKYARIQELNDIGNDKISTKTDGMLIPVDLLVRMARYQGIIGRICQKVRFIKIILTWEESIISFWITIVFLCTGLVSLLLPWTFILRWTSRIIVWGLFGPHMKIVDFYLEVQAKKNDSSLEKELEKFHEQSKMARLRREEAVKLKAVKEIRFGRYITEVPAYNLARHHDRPLPQSSARIYHREVATLDTTVIVEKSLWVPGQQLHGSMIPRPEDIHYRNQELETKQLDRLLLFEARLAALKAAEASGGGLERIRKRASMIRRAEEPRASGFELVCSDEGSSDEPLFGDLCIGPYQEDPKEDQEDGQKLPRMLSLATISQDEEYSDRSSNISAIISIPSTFEGYCERVLEEEGVEVVAWGHLAPESQTVDESQSAKEDEKQSIPFEDEEGAIHMITATGTSPGTLSILYQESDAKFVAFYRP